MVVARISAGGLGFWWRSDGKWEAGDLWGPFVVMGFCDFCVMERGELAAVMK